MLKESPVQMPPWIRERFPPNQRAAVDRLRGMVDRGMLREIAAADCGQEAKEHLAALLRIWKGAKLKALGTYCPKEVLELIRWSEPEDPEWKPGSIGPRGHQMRAFSCAILLAAPDCWPNKETLIQMVQSVLTLGREAEEATARFLTWRMDSLGRSEDRPFFALGLAALVQSIDTGLSPSEEQDLADWVEAEEATERACQAGFRETCQASPWLFGLSFGDMRNERWEALLLRLQRSSDGKPLGQMLARNYSPGPDAPENPPPA